VQQLAGLAETAWASFSSWRDGAALMAIQLAFSAPRPMTALRRDSHSVQRVQVATAAFTHPSPSRRWLRR
jgi:hypothetical protein